MAAADPLTIYLHESGAVVGQPGPRQAERFGFEAARVFREEGVHEWFRLVGHPLMDHEEPLTGLERLAERAEAWEEMARKTQTELDQLRESVRPLWEAARLAYDGDAQNAARAFPAPPEWKDGSGV